jgi:hypothetical protein
MQLAKSEGTSAIQQDDADIIMAWNGMPIGNTNAFHEYNGRNMQPC